MRLERDRHAHPAGHVLFAGLGPEHELSVVEKADTGPDDVWVDDERGDRSAKDVIGVVGLTENALDCLDRPFAHPTRSPFSSARTAARRSSGTGVGRLEPRSISTSVCSAVTISVSSGSRYAAHS